MRTFAAAAATLALAFGVSPTADAAFGIPEGERPSLLELEPSPHMTPHQVVDVQLRALAANTKLGEDRGIGLTFRFASPGNQSQTGPFPRFASMVKSRPYGALVDHTAAQLGPVQMKGTHAFIPVLVRSADGADRGYVWVLTRQTAGPVRDCWMTDAVYPAPPSAIRASTVGDEI